MKKELLDNIPLTFNAENLACSNLSVGVCSTIGRSEDSNLTCFKSDTLKTP